MLHRRVQLVRDHRGQGAGRHHQGRPRPAQDRPHLGHLPSSLRRVPLQGSGFLPLDSGNLTDFRHSSNRLLTAHWSEHPDRWGLDLQ